MVDSEYLTSRRQRGKSASLAVLGVLGLLSITFFRLQILSGSYYKLQSEENRFRAISVPAPRGTIYDRRGRVIADNVPGYAISILPGTRDTIVATLDRLGKDLNLSQVKRRELVVKNRARPHEPLVVLENADFDQVSFIEERRPQFSRVVVEYRPQRRYPAGRAIAHMIGYVGEISEPELANERFSGYQPGRRIGKAGLEAQYEEVLSGENGVRYVEVNALGLIVRDINNERGQPAFPGNDLQLGIDFDLQVLADSIFPQGMRGGVVALDPDTGEVLVLYSHPTFDPNQFIGGIPTDLWNTLRDDPGKPMLNRVSTASYPPGSTWKPIMAAIGMGTGAFGIDTYMQHPCRGGLQYGNRFFRCWQSSGHQGLDLAGAIKHSCNVFFYQAGQRIGLDEMMAGVDRLGFGEETGIDLPFEISGMFPPSREWFNQRYGRRGWTESVVWNLAIGQGENQQSLLSMVQFYAALATGEPPIMPHLARLELLDQRFSLWNLGLSTEQRHGIVEALVRVVNEPGGTAFGSRLDRWTLAGKTGTAQNPHGEPHSWFVGFSPAYDPKIVVAAIVEQGHPEGMSSLAPPLAAKIVDRYLESIGIAPELNLRREGSSRTTSTGRNSP